MTSEQAYIEGFVKRAVEYGLNEKEASETLKKAFSVYDDDHEVSRWYDGGPMWEENLNKKIKNFRYSPQHVAAMTKAFTEGAKRQGADVKFMGHGYAEDYMTPENALANIHSKKKLDLEDESLPNYYRLQYPFKERKGLLEKLRLRKPEIIDDWPEEHPLDIAVNEYKKYL